MAVPDMRRRAPLGPNRRGASSRRRTSYGSATKRQMAVIALTGVALELVIVHTALSGLHKVDMAYDRVGRIAQATGYFQNADQAHDALHADVIEAVLETSGVTGLPPSAGRGISADAAEFRRDLVLAQQVELPSSLQSILSAMRPVQERYVAAAEQLDALARDDAPAARGRLTAFNALFDELEQRQEDVTAELTTQGVAVQKRA